ncbi:MAG: hypothetical protein Q8835_03150, partial [Sweet potato little leaf phytoplasma]|nr:hypothetical protein [Sweet potato little leaf phytoplasma]
EINVSDQKYTIKENSQNFKDKNLLDFIEKIYLQLQNKIHTIDPSSDNARTLTCKNSRLNLTVTIINSNGNPFNSEYFAPAKPLPQQSAGPEES